MNPDRNHVINFTGTIKGAKRNIYEFTKTEFVERVGAGINRIRTSMKKSGLSKPVFDFDKHNFSVLLRSNKKVTEKVTENQKIIIKEIRKNKQITSLELSKIVRISDRKIKENIKKLKQKGLLKRIGPAKDGHWEIVG